VGVLLSVLVYNYKY